VDDDDGAGWAEVWRVALGLAMLDPDDRAGELALRFGGAGPVDDRDLVAVLAVLARELAEEVGAARTPAVDGAAVLRERAFEDAADVDDD
jgi:hypothetical protein